MAKDRWGLKTKFEGGKAETVWFTREADRNRAYDQLGGRKGLVYRRKVQR